MRTDTQATTYPALPNTLQLMTARQRLSNMRRGVPTRLYSSPQDARLQAIIRDTMARGSAWDMPAWWYQIPSNGD